MTYLDLGAHVVTGFGENLFVCGVKLILVILTLSRLLYLGRFYVSIITVLFVVVILLLIILLIGVTFLLLLVFLLGPCARLLL